MAGRGSGRVRDVRAVLGEEHLVSLGYRGEADEPGGRGGRGDVERRGDLAGLEASEEAQDQGDLRVDHARSAVDQQALGGARGAG